MRIHIPSPATIIAPLALLLSLTGTAVAGALITGAEIQNNTVGSVDLMNNRVKSVDLEDNGIKSIDVMNGQLRAVDFAPGQIPKAGPAGPADPAGPTGSSRPRRGVGQSLPSPRDSLEARSYQVDATCTAGKRLVGGGAQVYGANAEAALDESFPVDATKWRARRRSGRHGGQLACRRLRGLRSGLL